MTRIIRAAALVSLSVPFAASANARPVEFLFSGAQNYIQGQHLPPPYDVIGTDTPISASLVFDDAAVDQCPPGLGAGTFHVCFPDQTSELGFYAGISLSVSFNDVTVAGVPELVELWNDHDYLRHGSSADMFAAVTTLPDGTRLEILFLNDSSLNGNFGPQPPFTSDALPTNLDPTDWATPSIIINKGAAGLVSSVISEVIYRVVPESPAAILAVAGLFFFLCGPAGSRATRATTASCP